MWNDPQLAWNDIDFNGHSSITVQDGRIWYPEIKLACDYNCN